MAEQSARVIILDRDGVINWDSKEYIKSPEEFNFIPGSDIAIAKLSQLGFKVYICTNQAAINRGLFTVDVLSAIHAKLQSRVHELGGEIAAIFFCPHTPEENCSCRKPQPGLIKQVIDMHQIQDTSSLYMVGDSLKDLQAIAAVGGQPILVTTGNGKDTAASGKIPLNTQTYTSLLDFVNTLS